MEYEFTKVETPSLTLEPELETKPETELAPVAEPVEEPIYTRPLSRCENPNKRL